MRVVQFEAFTVVIFEFAVPLDKRPYLFGIEFLDTQDVILEMSRRIEGCGIIGTIVLNDEDAIFVKELAQIDAVLVVVDTEYIGIEPYLTTSERRMAFLTEGDRLDVEASPLGFAVKYTTFDPGLP